MGKLSARAKYIAIIFGIFCWFLSLHEVGSNTDVPVAVYNPIEPVMLLKSPLEYVGKLVKFQAKFSHIITPKTEELLRSTTGVKVDLEAYDSFKVYGSGFVFQRMLMSKKKDSVLYELKSDAPVTIYGEVFRLNMVGEPIILVHRIEVSANFLENEVKP